jgi:putative Holliday junction resolvase
MHNRTPASPAQRRCAYGILSLKSADGKTNASDKKPSSRFACMLNSRMSDKPRILGLDVGDRRIGVAISDPLHITAAGLETINRQTLELDVERIADLVQRHNVKVIVIGMPLNMDGSEGGQAANVVSFGKKLARATGLPVIYEDERLSTVSAIRTLTVQGLKTGHRKDLVDMQAAAIILQKYIDRNEPPPAG